MDEKETKRSRKEKGAPKETVKAEKKAPKKRAAEVEADEQGGSAKRGKAREEAEPKSAPKATFAGRRRPATDGARARFDAMKQIFEAEISEKLSVNIGMAEDRHFAAWNSFGFGF